MTHEVQLVKRGSTGAAIPTREYEILKAEAERLGPKHCAAFNEQVLRQTTAIQETT